MRIGVLTGGGDVPGLNPCIKSIVDTAYEEGHEVIGIRRGWAGLLEYNLDSGADNSTCVMPVNPERVRTIDRSGGTFLHTSRTNPSKVAPMTFRNSFEASSLAALPTTVPPTYSRLSSVSASMPCSPSAATTP